jgi:hypothetical protein
MGILPGYGNYGYGWFAQRPSRQEHIMQAIASRSVSIVTRKNTTHTVSLHFGSSPSGAVSAVVRDLFENFKIKSDIGLKTRIWNTPTRRNQGPALEHDRSSDHRAESSMTW